MISGAASDAAPFCPVCLARYAIIFQLLTFGRSGAHVRCRFTPSVSGSIGVGEPMNRFVVAAFLLMSVMAVTPAFADELTVTSLNPSWQLVSGSSYGAAT